MKENLFSDLPITDQATLTLITLIEVVKEKGVPPLPHAWEFPNMRGYTQEREGYPVPYLDLIFHRISGKPFIRDNAKLFSLHFDYLDHYGHGVSDTFDLFFNYYKRNKVVDAWTLDRNTEFDYNSLHSFIDKNFSREHQYNIVQGLSEVLKVIYKYGGVVHRRLHLTGVQYKFLRKKTAVEKLNVDATVFIESVRDITNVDSNPNLVQVQWNDDTPKQIEFLARPLNGSEPYENLVSMEFGYGVDEKCLMFKPAKFRDSLEFYSVLTPSADVDRVVELFGEFLALLVSQESYMTPDKVYSKEITYFLHNLEDYVFDFNYILNFLNLNYIFFRDQTRALDKVYCSFY